MSEAGAPHGQAPQGAEFQWFTGARGVKLRVLTAPAAGPARGSVIVAPGRTEFIEKYFEVAGELVERGFCVFVIDWRGQGLSGREVADSQKGHFRSLDDAVSDLSAILGALGEKLPKPWLLLAHSMGGGISLRALQLRKLDVVAAAFSSPMWGVPSVTVPAALLARSSRAIGAGGAFAPGVQKRWTREAFEGNCVTNCEVRHQRTQDLIAADERLALAGPTLGWVAAVADAFAAFRKPGAVEHIDVPVLLCSAGDEKLVDNRAHAAICARLPRCQRLVFEGAQHEILMERDAVRARFWEAFDALADKAAPRKG